MEGPPAPLPAPLCDFCNEPLAQIRVFDAAPLSMDVNNATVYFCDSRWAACPLCAALIDEGRWEDLTERSYELWLRAEREHGSEPGFRFKQFMKTHLTRLHQMFREARGRTA